MRTSVHASAWVDNRLQKVSAILGLFWPCIRSLLTLMRTSVHASAWVDNRLQKVFPATHNKVNKDVLSNNKVNKDVLSNNSNKDAATTAPPGPRRTCVGVDGPAYLDVLMLFFRSVSKYIYTYAYIRTYMCMHVCICVCFDVVLSIGEKAYLHGYPHICIFVGTQIRI
jgi:hypothetical protein